MPSLYCWTKLSHPQPLNNTGFYARYIARRERGGRGRKRQKERARANLHWNKCSGRCWKWGLGSSRVNWCRASRQVHWLVGGKSQRTGGMGKSTLKRRHRMTGGRCEWARWVIRRAGWLKLRRRGKRGTVGHWKRKWHSHVWHRIVGSGPRWTAIW